MLKKFFIKFAIGLFESLVIFVHNNIGIGLLLRGLGY